MKVISDSSINEDYCDAHFELEVVSNSSIIDVTLKTSLDGNVQLT